MVMVFPLSSNNPTQTVFMLPSFSPTIEPLSDGIVPLARVVFANPVPSDKLIIAGF